MEKPTIALVIDDHRLAKATTLLVKAHGLRTLTYHSATEALLDDERPTARLIVCDLFYTGATLHNFTNQCLKLCRGVPIILIANGSEALRNFEALAPNIAEIFEKPYIPTQLIAAITREL